jgi:hypothetical protein
VKFFSIVVAIIGGLTLPASAARQVFHWPWEVRTHHRHPPRFNPDAAAEQADCAKIMEAIRILDRENYARARSASTRAQLAVIDGCLNGTANDH